MVVVSKNLKKEKNVFVFFTFLKWEISDMVMGKKVAIFDWEWAEIRPLEMGRKSSDFSCFLLSANFFKIGIFEKFFQLYYLCQNSLDTDQA